MFNRRRLPTTKHLVSVARLVMEQHLKGLENSQKNDERGLLVKLTDGANHILNKMSEYTPLAFRDYFTEVLSFASELPVDHAIVYLYDKGVKNEACPNDFIFALRRALRVELIPQQAHYSLQTQYGACNLGERRVISLPELVDMLRSDLQPLFSTPSLK